MTNTLDLDAMRARAREVQTIEMLLRQMVYLPDKANSRRVARTYANVIQSAYDALAADVLALADEVERLRKDRDDAFAALANIQGVYANDN